MTECNHFFPTGGVPKAQPPGSVGDVNSQAKGSGARFNSGKAPYDLVPLTLIANSYPRYSHTQMALLHLGSWQETGEAADLVLCTQALGMDGWPECAAVFDYGRAKYAEWNWAKGMAWSIPLACAARHLIAMMNGEMTDPESGLSHRGHVFCNIVMLQTFMTTYPEGDDRPRCLA